MTVTCFLISGILLLATAIMFWGQWKMIKEEPWMWFFLIPLLALSTLPIFMYYNLQDAKEAPVQVEAKPFNPADMTDPRAQHLYNKFIETMIWEK